MKLYFSPFACSLASRFALYEANINCEFERVDLPTKTTESGSDFWNVSAKGKVAALALDGGQVLTENPVVLQYIADQAAPGELIPAHGQQERYEVSSWLSFVTSEIHKMGLYPLAASSVPEDMKAFTNDLLSKQLSLVDGVLSEREYIAGSFSVADAYLFWALTLLPKLGYGLPDELEHLATYQSRVGRRDAFQKALEEESALAAVQL